MADPKDTPATPHNPGLGPVPSDPAGETKPQAAPEAELPSDVEPDPSRQPT